MPCSNPVPVFRNGEVYYYPCGKCYNCTNLKSLNYEQQTRVESDQAKYGIFVTLTYAPEHLPTACIDIEQGFLNSCKVNLLCRTPRVAEYYKSDVIDTLEYDYLDISRYVRPFNYGKFRLPEPNTFGFLFYPDIQKFNKRLKYFVREYISNKLFNKNYRKLNGEHQEEVMQKVCMQRFFCIGEYGPKTFRPHWHFLYFSNSALLAEAIYDSVYKAWTYGRIDCQYTSNGACSYVSSYLNANQVLPRVLRDTFPTRCRHSLHYGFSSVEQCLKSLDQITYQGLRNRTLFYGGKIHSLSIPPALEANVFPKTYKFGEADDVCLYRRYTAYNALRTQYPDCTVEKMIDLYLNHEYRDDWFANLYHESILIPESPDQRATLRGLLYTSRKFLKNLETMEKQMDVFTYIKYIKNYYNEKASHALSEFYSHLETTYQYDDPLLQINEYNNIERTTLDYPDDETSERWRFVDVCRERLSRFCDAPLYEIIQHNYDPWRNPYISYAFTNAVRISKNKIKHKEQNDLNQIFVYE